METSQKNKEVKLTISEKDMSDIRMLFEIATVHPVNGGINTGVLASKLLSKLTSLYENQERVK